MTKADLNYEGSVTIDEKLLEESGIKPYQMVNINNLSNGAFWQTYAMVGKKGSGVICLNGPPARHFQPGDKVIIIAEAYVEPCELKGLTPIIVFVDEDNRIIKRQPTRRPHGTSSRPHRGSN